jgi:integrase
MPCMTQIDSSRQVALVVRGNKSGPAYDAVFRNDDGGQVWRRVGPAWLEKDSAGKWRPRHGRVQDGYYDERRAYVKATEIVTTYETELAEDHERRAQGATFREVAHAYLDWLENVKGAAPSTLRQHRSDLAEPGVPYKRGNKVLAGHIMRAFGDKPASKVTTEDVEELLETVADTDVAPRTVNRYREVVCAAFNFAMKSTKFKLPSNPATDADRRRLPAAGALVYYTPEEIEAIAQALEDGMHREVHERHARDCAERSGGRCDCTPTYRARGMTFPTLQAARAHNRQAREEDELMDDRRDADAVRVAAYAGLRMGELLPLRVGDIDWHGSALIVSRAVSAGVERGTKSGRVRQVPLADQASGALTRVLKRDDFTGRNELVFCNAYGRPLDGSALRRRYKRARDAVGLRPLRWHDLRHTFGSLLVAGGIDLVSVKDAMGHSQLTTTSRYLHARPATERASAFTAAFERTAGRQPELA